MPIKPENRSRYPKDWPAISADVKMRARWRCEFCGVPHGQLGGRSPAGVWHAARPIGQKNLRLEWPEPGTFAHCAGYDAPLRIVRIVLTTAHLDHQPENCDPSNLKALCQRCHNRHDQPHRKANAAATHRAKKAVGDLFEGN
jgi:5-methylcytosine-specific restriction endonuclease McrA